MHCGHCGNKTIFAIHGSFTQKHYYYANGEECDPNDRGSQMWDQTTWQLLICSTCKQPTLTREYVFSEELEVNSTILYPIASAAPKPSSDMPEDLIRDYEEARSVLPNSPRASAALLRLLLQKLCIHLGQPGKDLNTDIVAIVKAGNLSPKVQQALDSVRVIGNNAVHPGSIDLRDDSKLALALFGLINFIVEEMITRPREIDKLYSNLPAGQLDQIKKRDQTAQKSKH